METISTLFKTLVYFIIGVVVLGFILLIGTAGGFLFLIGLAVFIGYVFIAFAKEPPPK